MEPFMLWEIYNVLLPLIRYMSTYNHKQINRSVIKIGKCRIKKLYESEKRRTRDNKSLRSWVIALCFFCNSYTMSRLSLALRKVDVWLTNCRLEQFHGKSKCSSSIINDNCTISSIFERPSDELRHRLHLTSHFCGKSYCSQSSVLLHNFWSTIVLDSSWHHSCCWFDSGNANIKDVSVRLGGFHLGKNFLSAIGRIMSGSGLEEILGLIYAGNCVTKIMDSSVYSRAVRAHSLVRAALSPVIFDLTEFEDASVMKLN